MFAFMIVPARLGNQTYRMLLDNNSNQQVTEYQSFEIKKRNKIIWSNVIIVGYLHLAGIIGLYIAITNTKWQTLLFSATLFILCQIGVNAGAHRLWAHRTYKANIILRSMLMVLFTVAFEGTIYSWARDHRVHHKYQDTDADPYNVNRGFWFSHVGWLLLNKHPDVERKGKLLDFSDLKEDKVVKFQYKYFWFLILSLCLLMPTFIPWFFWNESLSTAWYVAFGLRCCLSLNSTFTVNSLAHMYGNRPYEATICARENKGTSIITLGEGWHNYHHTFPWDYRASEMHYDSLTTKFIDLMAALGWAYSLKTTSPNLIKKRASRTGDGTFKEIWGWDDKEISSEDKEGAIIIKNTN